MILFLIIIIHGLIHLTGFAKAFKLAEMAQITQSISRPFGTLWLLCAILFVATAFLFLFHKSTWWKIAGPAVIVSQILTILAWSDAKYGTLINIILLFPIIISFMDAQSTSFRNTYRSEVQNRLKTQSDMPLVSEADIRGLPGPVQKYLHYTGAVGRPRVWNFRARFTGQMRFRKDDAWINIVAQQYDFFNDSARFFYIESNKYGIPFDGLHLYIGSSATMQIKVASLFKVVDARGMEMNQGETVTLFNDMCLLAPATLIDGNIQWETVNALTVKARFANEGNAIGALLYFNEKGELIDFVSDDRFYSTDGKTFKKYRWSTPVTGYKDVGGRKIVAYGEAVWHTSEGEYSYAKFKLDEIEYNCREYK